MTEQEWNAKAAERMERMVNAIADREYAGLLLAIPPKLSWADGEPTPENACLGFGEWLDGQLAMWEEDEGKKVVVDHFDASCLDKIERRNGNAFCAAYRPTSFGEELDLWFEIDLEVKGEQITAVFDVNM